MIGDFGEQIKGKVSRNYSVKRRRKKLILFTKQPPVEIKPFSSKRKNEKTHIIYVIDAMYKFHHLYVCCNNTSYFLTIFLLFFLSLKQTYLKCSLQKTVWSGKIHKRYPLPKFRFFWSMYIYHHVPYIQQQWLTWKKRRDKKKSSERISFFLFPK